MSEKVTTFLNELILNGESVFKNLIFRSSVQFSLSVVSDSVNPQTAACQASLSITNSRSLLKLMSIESVMPSNHLILCRPLLLPSIFPSIRVFSNESALCIRWPKYQSFSFSISPSNEYSGLISFRIDWFDLLAVQGLAVPYSGVFSPLNDCPKLGIYKNLLFKKLIFTYLIVRNILAYKNIPTSIISMGLVC